jgi:hypothetical protein
MLSTPCGEPFTVLSDRRRRSNILWCRGGERLPGHLRGGEYMGGNSERARAGIRSLSTRWTVGSHSRDPLTGNGFRPNGVFQGTRRYPANRRFFRCGLFRDTYPFFAMQRPRPAAGVSPAGHRDAGYVSGVALKNGRTARGRLEPEGASRYVLCFDKARPYFVTYGHRERLFPNPGSPL